MHSHYSRRKFLLTAGTATVSTLFLKGCLGNPPSTETDSASQVTPAANVGAGEAPETTTVKLGYIPIVEYLKLIPSV